MSWAYPNLCWQATARNSWQTHNKDEEFSWLKSTLVANPMDRRTGMLSMPTSMRLFEDHLEKAGDKGVLQTSSTDLIIGIKCITKGRATSTASTPAP